MCIREQSLYCGASQSAVRRCLTEFVYCVTVAFTNLLLFKGDFSFEKSQNLQEVMSGL